MCGSEEAGAEAWRAATRKRGARRRGSGARAGHAAARAPAKKQGRAEKVMYGKKSDCFMGRSLQAVFAGLRPRTRSTHRTSERVSCREYALSEGPTFEESTAKQKHTPGTIVKYLIL